MPVNLFPACFFPPIPWYVAACQHEELYLDARQPYRKQQYSSRAYIKVANRVMPLTLPVERRDRHHPIQEKRVVWAENWPHQHWQSLVSAYANSPYFEFYREELAQIYQERFLYLHEWLSATTHWGLKAVEWEGEVKWATGAQEAQADYRRDFDPTRRVQPAWFAPISYPQVFEGFDEGLSILDLVFNLGPESRLYLRQAWIGAG